MQRSWKAACAVCGLLAVWLLGAGMASAQVVPPVNKAAPRPNLSALMLTALEKLGEARNSGDVKKYQAAYQALKKFHQEALRQGDKTAQVLAEHYLREIAPWVKEKSAPTPVRELRKFKPKAKPKAVPPKDWQDFFAPGRQFASVSFAHTQGLASNRLWIFQGDVWFTHWGQSQVKMRVKKRNGQALVLEVVIPQVRQDLVVSRQKMVIRDNAIVQLLQAALKDLLLRPAPPPVQVVLEVIEIFNAPLQKIKDELILNIAKVVGFLPNVDVEVRQKIDAISNHTFEITYVNGLGVTDLRITKGKNLEERYLRDLAKHLSRGALGNYLLSDLAKARPGTVKTYRAEDLIGMLGFTYDVDAFGTLTLKRLNDDKKGRAKFQIIKASVTVTAFINGKVRQGTFLIDARNKLGQGIVYYRYNKNGNLKNLGSWYVEEAFLDWESNLSFVHPRNLLFGVKGVRELVTRSYFKAAPVPKKPPRQARLAP